MMPTLLPFMMTRICLRHLHSFLPTCLRTSIFQYPTFSSFAFCLVLCLLFTLHVNVYLVFSLTLYFAMS